MRQLAQFYEGISLYNTGTPKSVAKILRSNDDPEGAISANPGSLCLRSTGAMYLKRTGSGNTGWEAVGAGSAAATDFKESVICATTANITLTGLQTIDGIAVTAGQRILVKNQSLSQDNGIYIASATAWARSIDTNEDNEVTEGLTVFVEQGTASADRFYYLATVGAGSLGTKTLSFAVIPTYGAGAGLEADGAGGLRINIDETNDTTYINAANELAVTNLKFQKTTVNAASTVVSSVHAESGIHNNTHTALGATSIKWDVQIADSASFPVASFSVDAMAYGKESVDNNGPYNILINNAYTNIVALQACIDSMVVNTSSGSIHLVFSADNTTPFDVYIRTIAYGMPADIETA